ncbi:hypothetical protein C0Q70_02407 [Pomacea canaliculata]|uniref:G-protein coupled receptors family 1 profile domain-containing protein n=1 Tax=Pomacea canaliculata TaxID=400727 RepID=A0A2T7PPW0_POMCA|nr:hypothetical protein C0Q70_02407 [Pomacea canaliculata]
MTGEFESALWTNTFTLLFSSTSASSSDELLTEDNYKCHDNKKGVLAYHSDVHYVEIAGIVPVAFLGMLGNIIALLVWTVKTKYNATTLFLEHLCVWDSLFLLMYATLILYSDAMLREVIYVTTFFISTFQLMSVHVTLGAVVTRLVAVTRPLVVRDLLTRRRVYVVYVGIIVWCLLLASLEIVAYSCGHLEKITRWKIFVSKQVVGLILPHVALFVVNAYLFYFLRRHGAIVRQTLHGRRTPDSSKKAQRRLTLTLFCMSVCSLISFPFGVFFQLLMEAEYAGLISATSTCDRKCSVLVDRVFHLLQVLNSSVNIIFYAAFCTNFRQLFLRRVQHVRGLARSLSTSSSSSSSSSSSRRTMRTDLYAAEGRIL